MNSLELSGSELRPGPVEPKAKGPTWQRHVFNPRALRLGKTGFLLLPPHLNEAQTNAASALNNTTAHEFEEGEEDVREVSDATPDSLVFPGFSPGPGVETGLANSIRNGKKVGILSCSPLHWFLYRIL